MTETVEFVVGAVFVDVDDRDTPIGVEILAPLSPADVVALLQLLRDTLPR